MNEKTTITVNEGKICGIIDTSKFSGTEYYAFFGVPYGQPTNDDMRFKDPVKVEPWEDVFDARVEKYGCAQFSLRHFLFMGSEDCLYTNIFTNKLPSSEDEPLRPVIVNIHPGGLMYGSPDSSHYGSPDLVIHNDIVYVCIGFRLHILGFLNLGMEECSGNQGLKDLIMGLEWIRDNIRVFGGDPDNVTLIGSSSGCEIIHILMLLPAAKGLFHKAAIMGMYAFNPALYRRNYREESEKAAFEIARKIGYNGKDKKSLLSFLKKTPVSMLIVEFRAFQKDKQRFAQVFQSGIFHPTIDEGENAILTVPPRELISSMAKKPILFGICERESIIGFCLSGVLKKKVDRYLLSTYRQNEWGWGYNLTNADVKEITKKAEKFYANGGSLNKAPLAVKVDFQTDIGFSDVYDTLLNIVSEDLPSSVFVYKFLYEGSIITLKTLLSPTLEEPLDGTFHAADYEYWARMDDTLGVKRKYDEKTTAFINKFTKLISTFAKTGDPNYEGLEVKWRPMTPENPCYLEINESLKMIDDKLNADRMKFWDKVKEEFAKG